MSGGNPAWPRRPASKFKTKLAYPRPANDDALTGESCAPAVLVCAIGYFMRLLLAGPTLNLFGVPYGDSDASTFAKIHPGDYLIVASFFILLCHRIDPIGQLVRIARRYTAYFALFAIYVMVLFYWILRGPKGVGVILDVHIVMPICVIVFCYASRAWCRAIVFSYAAFAFLNSAIGIVEAATHSRILPFDSSWEVTLQEYFRASALMGHPLVNAAFTSASMFVILALRMPTWIKSIIFTVMLASLVGFGGRSSFGLGLIGLGVLGVIEVGKRFASRRLSVMQLILVIFLCLALPLLCGGMLYGVLHSSVGERLMAYSSLQDESASVRLLSWQAFDFVSPTEMIFGVDGDRVVEIGNQLGVVSPTSDIENPWILMFLFLGAILFPIWLVGLICFIRRLLTGASPALQIAVIDYFLISATSNSFGRKDPIFVTLPAIIICVKKLNDFTARDKARQIRHETYP